MTRFYFRIRWLVSTNRAALSHIARTRTNKTVELSHGLLPPPCLSPPYELGKRCPAAFNGLVAQVLAVKLDQVEGVEEHVPVIAPTPQSVEHRQSIAVTGDGLTVDQARHSLERERGARDQGEAAGPVVAVAGEQPHGRPITQANASASPAHATHSGVRAPVRSNVGTRSPGRLRRGSGRI